MAGDLTLNQAARVRSPPRVFSPCSRHPMVRTAGFQPENVGFDSHRECSSACSSTWRQHVHREHGDEGSNPSRLTHSVGGRAAIAAACNTADPWSSGVRFPPYALRLYLTHTVSPNGGTPASKSGVGRFDPFTVCCRAERSITVSSPSGQALVCKAGDTGSTPVETFSTDATCWWS